MQIERMKVDFKVLQVSTSGGLFLMFIVQFYFF
jgi:hypothetical protein